MYSVSGYDVFPNFCDFSPVAVRSARRGARRSRLVEVTTATMVPPPLGPHRPRHRGIRPHRGGGRAVIIKTAAIRPPRSCGSLPSWAGNGTQLEPRWSAGSSRVALVAVRRRLTRAEQQEETKARVLEAAIKLFARKGL